MRQHIVETASALFYQKGYNLTGINEIIAKSEIAKATLYHHFRSKEEICIAYLQFRNTAFLAEIEAFCQQKPQGSAQLYAIFEFLQVFFEDHNFNGCWCIRTAAEIPQDNEKIKAEIQTQKEAFLRLIARLIETNLSDISSAEQDLLTRQIYLLYEGAVAESHLHGQDWPIQAAQTMCEKLC